MTMTTYEQGFLTKCAELGVPEQVAGEMLKVAAGPVENQVTLGAVGGPGLLGAALGGTVGALSSREKRLRKALIGALIGAGVGSGAGYLRSAPIRSSAKALDAARARFDRLASSGPFTYTKDPKVEKDILGSARKLGLTGLAHPGEAANYLGQAAADVTTEADRVQRVIDAANGNYGDSQWGALGHILGF